MADMRLKDNGHAIPPLESGDRLTRDEFERRYQAMPSLKKAELVEGVVYVPSPVRLEQHGEPHLDFSGWLGLYRAHTPGIRGGNNATVRLDLNNEPQPDAVLFIDPVFGGQALIDQNGYLAKGPDLAGEITASTASLDMGAKKDVYRRNSVREYVVWRVLDRVIDWFILRQGQYEPLLPQDGIHKSVHLPGLWLDAQALIAGDLARVHEVLGAGIASPEHAQFGEALKLARIS